jgi:autotransporter-associated beta strand protein
MTGSAQGAARWWDGGTMDIGSNGNGASQGGAGTWNTTIKNWDAGASPHVAWVNASHDIAVFGGTAGTVTLGTLQFNSAAASGGTTYSGILTPGGNNLDLTGFANASLATWDNVGTVSFAYTGTLTPANTTYRFGGARGGNYSNLPNANTLTGARSLVVIPGSISKLRLQNANDFSGDTLVHSGTLYVTHSLALQNSAIDTSAAGTMDVTGATAPTFGGLKGSKGIGTLITTAYGSVTGLTLNPGAGVTNIAGTNLTLFSTNVAHNYASVGSYFVRLTVSVAAVPPPFFPSVGAISVNPSGQVALRIVATTGVRYQLVYKNDLGSTNAWTSLTNGWTSGTSNGPLTVGHQTATNSPQRFYKVEAKSKDAAPLECQSAKENPARHAIRT